MRYIDADKLTKDLIENKSFYPAIVKRAIEEAPTVQVMGEWISVDDRLPVNDYEKHWKNRNYYLVYTKPCGKMFVAKYGYKDNDWWCDMNDFVLNDKNWLQVTHWMPLPTPPQIKGE